jgi:hypothetical protein
VNPHQWNIFERWMQTVLRKLDTIIHTIKCEDKPKARGGYFDYSLGPDTNKRKAKVMLEKEISNEQQFVAHLNPKTPGGKPAQVDGVPTWEIITGNSTVTPESDGLSAAIVSSDDPGDTDILVKADADLGEGVVEISDIIRVHVKGAQAASLGLTADEPTNK